MKFWTVRLDDYDTQPEVVVQAENEQTAFGVYVQWRNKRDSAANLKVFPIGGFADYLIEEIEVIHNA